MGVGSVGWTREVCLPLVSPTFAFVVQLWADTLFGKDTPILFTQPRLLPKVLSHQWEGKSPEGKHFLASAM